MTLPKKREPNSRDPRDLAHAGGWNLCVEAMEEALASGHTPWIPVGERLPATSEPVLVILPPPRNSDEPILIVAEYWRPGPLHDVEACWCDPDGEVDPPPTHWAPIPALPSKEMK